VADDEFLAQLASRDCVDDGEDWTEAWCWARGKFRSERTVPGLWRLRMPGSWYRYAWVDGEGRRPVKTDEAYRAVLALGRATREPVPVLRKDGQIEVELPHLPRAEYRAVLACADGRRGRVWVLPGSGWPALRELLQAQLGLAFEERDGQA